MTRPNKIGCLLMAAGNASRFQSNKLLAEFRGKPLVLWALERIDPARLSVAEKWPSRLGRSLYHPPGDRIHGPMRRNLVPCCRPAAAGCRSHRQNFGNLARKPGPDRRSGPRRQDGQPLYLPPGIFPGIMPVTGRCRRKMRNQSAFRPALDRRSRAGRAV